MRKSKKIQTEIDNIKIKIAKLYENLNIAKYTEKNEDNVGKFQYRIVLDRIEKMKKTPFEVSYSSGLPVMVDDYGMGAVHWSLIEKKEDAQERQLMDNVLWAVSRLKWAVENNPDEISELKKILLTGGKSRYPKDWKNLPKRTNK